MTKDKKTVKDTPEAPGRSIAAQQAEDDKPFQKRMSDNLKASDKARREHVETSADRQIQKRHEAERNRGKQ